MKFLRKFASIALALVMVLALAAPAFAADIDAGMTGPEGNTGGYADNASESGNETDTRGSITIQNAADGEAYNAYRIFDLKSYDRTDNSEAYSYKTNITWAEFVVDGAPGAEYVNIDEQGYVTWKENKLAEADVKAFAAAALAWAKSQDISADYTAVASDSKASFNNMDLGYYLVESAIGTICNLNTTDNDIVITEKNEEPTIDKEVKKVDADGQESWEEENSASIGDAVEFRITVHAKKDGLNYVVHDKMESGLTLNRNSFKVMVGDTILKGVTGTQENGDAYDLLLHAEDEGAHTTSCPVSDSECTFEIKILDEYLAILTDDTDIVITYTAVLNENAEIASGSNDNEAKLTYGNNSATEWDTTKTYTYQFDLVKTDSDKKMLDGAKFKLYKATYDSDITVSENDNGTGATVSASQEVIQLIKDDDGAYRPAVDGETGIEEIEVTGGHIKIKGLGEGYYFLEETAAPSGYNKLDDAVGFEIKDTNLNAVFAQDGSYESDGVQVINNTGTRLPSTGGIGTTIFYIVGGVLLVGAVVLLIAKRRTSADEE